MLGLGLRVWIDGVSRDDRSGRERRVRRLQLMNGKSAQESGDRWRPIWRHVNPYSSGVVDEGERVARLGHRKRAGGVSWLSNLADLFGGPVWRTSLAVSACGGTGASPD